MGGGHHHGGGGHRGGGGTPWLYGNAYGWGLPADYEVVVAEPACPQVFAPVLGVDGKVYPSACNAARAGVAVKKQLPAGMGDLSTAIGQMGVTGYLVLGGAAYVLYRLLKGKK